MIDGEMLYIWEYMDEMAFCLRSLLRLERGVCFDGHGGKGVGYILGYAMRAIV